MQIRRTYLSRPCEAAFVPATAPGAQAQAGTSLIEVLVTLLVLMIGMLGMSKIQALLIQNGSTANHRAMATSLAQEKLEDLRGFKWLNAASSYGENCGAGVFCYAEIETPDSANGRPGGGHEAAGSGNLQFPSGSILVGQAQFERTWFVVDHGTFKQVKVVVRWRDQNGEGSEMLESAIAADNPATNAFAATQGTRAVAGPKRPYTAGVAGDVVPLTLGLGSHRASSQPETVVSSNSLSLATQFHAINYNSAGEQSREDYATLACHCQFATPARANPPAYFSYAMSQLTVQYPRGEADQVTKVTGIPVAPQQGEQHPLCQTCCADHHDSDAVAVPAASASTALFDPARLVADYAPSGNHKHYQLEASSPEMAWVEVAEISGNAYLEACRFLRLDGIYRIMQDWRLVELTVMPEDYLASAGIPATPQPALARYQAFVSDVVNGQAMLDAGTAASWDKSGLPTRDLSVRGPNEKQLLARGIYVDRVYAAPRTLNPAYYSAFLSGTVTLDRIPFNEVSLTSLAGWASSHPGVVRMSDEATRQGRALVQPGSGGTANISAYALPGNSGLTGGAKGESHGHTADALSITRSATDE